MAEDSELPVLDDPYLLPMKQLGSGGQADVWLVRHLLTGRYLAAKLPREEWDPTVRRRFQKEIARHLRCGGRGVVGVVAYNVLGKRPYALMEWMRLGSLDQRLTRMLDRGFVYGTLGALGEIHEIATHLGGLHAAGLVHHDLKPGNILIADDGSKRLADLGLSVTLGVRMEHAARGFYGTLDYAAPEQLQDGESKVGYESDVFALGVMLYELLMGFPMPWWMTDIPWPSDCYDDVPAAVDDLIRRLAHRDRDQRPRTGAQAAAEIGTTCTKVYRLIR